MERLTNEVVTQYCIENGVPQVFRTNEYMGLSHGKLAKDFLRAQSSGDQSGMSNVKWKYYSEVNYSRYGSEPSIHSVLQVPYAYTTPPFASYVALVNMRNVLAFVEGRPYDHQRSEIRLIVKYLNDTERDARIQNWEEISNNPLTELDETLRRFKRDGTPITKLSRGRFGRILQLSLQTGNMSEVVYEEANNRMQFGRVNREDVLGILFSSTDLGSQRDALRQNALKVLYKHGDFLEEIVSDDQARQEWCDMEEIQFFKHRINDANGAVNTVGYAVATVGNDVITSDVFASASSERCLQLAAASLVAKSLRIIEQEDREAQEAALSEETDISRLGNDEAEKIKERDNFTLKLQSLCENNTWVISENNVSTNEDNGTVKYVARMSIKIGDINFTESTTATTGREAQYLTAKKLFLRIRGPKRDKTHHIEALDQSNLRDSARLLAESNGLPIPEFAIIYTGEADARVVNCVCYFKEPSGRVAQFVGCADNEEKAMKLVATKIIIAMDRQIRDRDEVDV